MVRKLVVLGMLVSLVWTGRAAGASTAGAAVTIISPTARAWGLGQSYVAVADDATATYWNPGGLGFLEGTDVSLTHSKLVPMLADDVYFESVNLSHRVPDIGTFAMSLAYLSLGKWPRTDDAGNLIGEESSYEWALGGYYAFPLGKSNAFGIGLKAIYSALVAGEATGWSFAADAGILGHPLDWLSYGVALQNLGPNISYVNSDQSEPLYRTFRVGAALVPITTDFYSLLLSLESSKLLVEIKDIELSLIHI